MKLSVIVSLLILSANAIPDSVDWRVYTPVVKNEGTCQSSYAFAATGAMEAAFSRKTGKPYTLSEQQIIDCSLSYGNSGCSGGSVTNAFEYILANKGIDTEASYPYRGDVEDCGYLKSGYGGTIIRYLELPSGNETALTESLATSGPIAAYIDASSESFKSYKDGIYNDPTCSTTNLTRAVLIVGYGTENGQDYYLVKNSWGEGWGESGYFKIARNGKNTCGIASKTSYPVV